MVWNLINWLNTRHDQSSAQPSEHAVEMPREPESGVTQHRFTGERRLHVVEDPARRMFNPNQSEPVGERHLSDSLRLDRLHHETAATKSAMAYWRRDTRREQPADKNTYDRFAESGHNWSTIKTEPDKGTKSGEYPTVDLANFLIKDTKDGMYGLYARKVQREFEKRLTERSDDEVAEEGSASSISSSALELPPRPDYADEYFYAHPEPQAVAASPLMQALPSAVEAKIDSWTEPVQAEVRESLHSIAASPALDEALPAAPDLRDTLDRLPYAEFIDVRIAVADHPDTSMEILEQLSHDEHPDVRFAIAENHNVSRQVLLQLTEDENPYVANRARHTLQRLEGSKKPLQAPFGRSTANSERLRQVGGRKS